MAEDEPRAADEPVVFTTTRWDLIRLAGSDDPAESARRQAARALNDLCTIYYAPILAYLQQRTTSRQDAEDLAQQFCSERISAALLANTDAEKGRFRSLLLTALKNFLHDRNRHCAAERRGGKIQFVPLNEFRDAAPASAAADVCFDIVWATTVVRRALDHLQHHCAHRSDGASYQQLLPFLGRVADHAQLSEVAGSLGLNANALGVRVSRFRALFARFVRQELALTVRTPAEIEPETRYLLEVLAATGN